MIWGGSQGTGRRPARPIYWQLALVIALLIGSLACALGEEAGPVEGVVLDADTGAGIAGAKVIVFATTNDKVTLCYASTLDSGHYAVPVPVVWAGKYRISSELIGSVRRTWYHRYSCSALTWSVPKKGYENLYFFTQFFDITIEVPGYETFHGQVIAYDLCACAVRVGKKYVKPGWAKIDPIVLARKGSSHRSEALATYLTFSDLSIDPATVSSDQTVIISARYIPAPGQQECAGKVVALLSVGKKVIEVRLKDDGKGPDKTPGDLVYTGQLRIDKSFAPGDYSIDLLAIGQPWGKRPQDGQPLKGKQLAARNILTGTLTVK